MENGRDDAKVLSGEWLGMMLRYSVENGLG